MPTNKSTTKKKAPKYEELPKFSNKIKNMKDTFQHLVFVACAEDGKIKADDETADNFEVMSKKTIKKSALKLVKKGLFNVRDGVFTISKKGKQHISYKRKMK